MLIVVSTLYIDTFILPAIILNIFSFHILSLKATWANWAANGRPKQLWGTKHGGRQFFKIIAGRINIYTIMVVSYMGSLLQSANCNVLSILNCVLIREVFFNFQCIYFCCKKIIHNFLFAKNIQLIWNLFQSAIWGWWRWWVWEISLEANQFIKRMDHNWWLSLGLYQTWFHPGIFLCLW